MTSRLQRVWLAVDDDLVVNGDDVAAAPWVAAGRCAGSPAASISSRITSDGSVRWDLRIVRDEMCIIRLYARSRPRINFSLLPAPCPTVVLYSTVFTDGVSVSNIETPSVLSGAPSSPQAYLSLAFFSVSLTQVNMEWRRSINDRQNLS